MIPGLNTNVEYENLTWHVQTEDQGSQRNRFITQVFRAGEVIATSETTYAHGLDLGTKLRQQRRAHRAMIDALRAGRLTDLD